MRPPPIHQSRATKPPTSRPVRPTRPRQCLQAKTISLSIAKGGKKMQHLIPAAALSCRCRLEGVAKTPVGSPSGNLPPAASLARPPPPPPTPPTSSQGRSRMTTTHPIADATIITNRPTTARTNKHDLQERNRIPPPPD